MKSFVGAPYKSMTVYLAASGAITFEQNLLLNIVPICPQCQVQGHQALVSCPEKHTRLPSITDMPTELPPQLLLLPATLHHLQRERPLCLTSRSLCVPFTWLTVTSS